MRTIKAYLKHCWALTVLVWADPSKASECSDEEHEWWVRFMGSDADIIR